MRTYQQFFTPNFAQLIAEEEHGRWILDVELDMQGLLLLLHLWEFRDSYPAALSELDGNKAALVGEELPTSAQREMGLQMMLSDTDSFANLAYAQRPQFTAYSNQPVWQLSAPEPFVAEDDHSRWVMSITERQFHIFMCGLGEFGSRTPMHLFPESASLPRGGSLCLYNARYVLEELLLVYWKYKPLRIAPVSRTDEADDSRSIIGGSR